ncbi:MAG TPA: hypothetical protein VNL71_18650, partial [Chloroflexota bacterium]|nr:hypothetical protein [Chloroflexota bacterium]
MPSGTKRPIKDLKTGGTGAGRTPGPSSGRPVLTAVRRAPQREWFGYVLALPALLLLGIVVLYPIVQGVILSFTNASTLTPGRSFIGLENYQQIFADPIFGTALKNSIILTTVAVGLELVLGMGLALLLCLPL